MGLAEITDELSFHSNRLCCIFNLKITSQYRQVNINQKAENRRQ